MKKTYNKPEIVFEQFTLNTNIAGDCEHKTWNPSNGTCAYDFSGIDVFTTTMGACIDWPIDDSNGEGLESGNDYICYHVPHGENLFNS